MSKFFFYASALFLPLLCTAQQVVDFESMVFPSGQNYWNGSDESGGFTLNGATFSNSYNTSWSSWSGFSVSSEVDVTTAGWLNQYSCFAGTGANNSQKFAVYYPSGEITFNDPTQPVSIAITNTTYAGLSMRDGDQYAKQFGSIYGANGEEDGTMGKDWFKLIIIGLDANNDVTAEVEFYLADYRSDDSTNHYILDVWETVDLSSLGTVTKILFELSSSDLSDWGIWTPEYFAFDDLTFFQSGVGISQEALPNYVVYPNPAQDVMHIRQTDNQDFSVNITNASGTVVLVSASATQHSIEAHVLPNGVYFVQMTSISGTRTERIVIAH